MWVINAKYQWTLNQFKKWGYKREPTPARSRRLHLAAATSPTLRRTECGHCTGSWEAEPSNVRHPAVPTEHQRPYGHCAHKLAVGCAERQGGRGVVPAGL